MNDKEFAELQLRATIVPQQVRWPAPEYLHWQRLHEAVNEARERVSNAYMQMDEIDLRTDLSREDKRDERQRIAAQAIAEFEASKTLARAREAVGLLTVGMHIAQIADAMLKALKETELAGKGRSIRSPSVPV